MTRLFEGIEKRALLLRLGVVLVLAAITYGATLGFGFVFDDKMQIVENTSIQSWGHIAQYFTRHVWEGVFSGGGGSYYRPIFLLWLRILHALFDYHPLGWHIANLMLHLQVTVLVFHLTRVWTRNDRIATWAALIFAVHPVHAEAVSWISACNETLFTMFGLAAIAAAIERARTDNVLYQGLSWVLFALALFSKETAIMFMPLIAICIAYEQPREAKDRMRRLAQKTIPYLVLTLFYACLRYWALSGVARVLSTHTVEDALRMWPYLILYYTKQLFWLGSRSLVAQIDWIDSWASPTFFLPLFVVAVIAVFAWRASRGNKAVAISFWLLFLPILPALFAVRYF